LRRIPETTFRSGFAKSALEQKGLL